MAAGKRIRVTFNLKQEADGTPVFFKSDGQRFPGHHLTVKFQQDETYRVDVTIRPAIPLECLRLHEEKLDMEPIIKVIDPNALSYSGVWKTTGFTTTGKNKREQLKIFFTLKNSGSLMTSLQCKFYEASSAQHARWGTKLTNLEYECSLDSGGNLTILTEQIV